MNSELFVATMKESFSRHHCSSWIKQAGLTCREICAFADYSIQLMNDIEKPPFDHPQQNSLLCQPSICKV